jgi:acyl-CoA thioesterase FadM
VLVELVAHQFRFSMALILYCQEQELTTVTSQVVVVATNNANGKVKVVQAAVLLQVTSYN